MILLHVFLHSLGRFRAFKPTKSIGATGGFPLEIFGWFQIGISGRLTGIRSQRQVGKLLDRFRSCFSWTVDVFRINQASGHTFSRVRWTPKSEIAPGQAPMSQRRLRVAKPYKPAS